MVLHAFRTFAFWLAYSNLAAPQKMRRMGANAHPRFLCLTIAIRLACPGNPFRIRFLHANKNGKGCAGW
jgi:hypothetical protein